MLWITRPSGRLLTLTLDLLVAPVYAVRRELFWVARPRVSWMRVRDAVALYRSYWQLANLDARLRQDLGLDDDAVRALLLLPTLIQLSPWAPEKLKQSVEESQAIGRAANGRNLTNTPAATSHFIRRVAALTWRRRVAIHRRLADTFPVAAAANCGCRFPVAGCASVSSLHDHSATSFSSRKISCLRAARRKAQWRRQWTRSGFRSLQKYRSGPAGHNDGACCGAGRCPRHP